MNETKPTAAEIVAEPAGRRMDKWVAQYVLKIDGKRAEMYSRNTISALYALENIGEVLYWDLRHQYNKYAFEIVYYYLGEHYCRAENYGDTKAVAICRALLTLFCVEMA